MQFGLTKKQTVENNIFNLGNYRNLSFHFLISLYYGFFKRFMELYERKKKMVALSYNYGVASSGSVDSFRRGFCFGSVHLYVILVYKRLSYLVISNHRHSHFYKSIISFLSMVVSSALCKNWYHLGIDI